jgi:hypothetical protein
MYSRTKARDLLVASGRSYDRVVFTRFDINTMIELDLSATDDGVYMARCHLPRFIISDHTIVTTQEVFVKWFDLYKHIFEIQKNENLRALVASYQERILINAEEILFAMYLFHFSNLDKIRYYTGGKCV